MATPEGDYTFYKPEHFNESQQERLEAYKKKLEHAQAQPENKGKRPDEIDGLTSVAEERSKKKFEPNPNAIKLYSNINDRINQLLSQDRSKNPSDVYFSVPLEGNIRLRVHRIEAGSLKTIKLTKNALAGDLEKNPSGIPLEEFHINDNGSFQVFDIDPASQEHPTRRILTAEHSIKRPHFDETTQAGLERMVKTGMSFLSKQLP